MAANNETGAISDLDAIAAVLDDTGSSALWMVDCVQALGKLPLEFSPGDAWNYSVATDVLGWLVQVVSGRPFEQFLADEIFAPLGMVDTGFHVREGQQHRFAACYQPDKTGTITLQDDPTTSSYLTAPSFISGGGGLVSTASDYLQFCRMLLNANEFVYVD